MPFIPEGPLRVIFEYLHNFRLAEIHQQLLETYTFKIYDDDLTCLVHLPSDRHITYHKKPHGLVVNVFEMRTDRRGALMIQNTFNYTL